MAKVRKKLSKHQVNLAPVDGRYGSSAAMFAAQSQQSSGFWYWNGSSYFEYLGTTNGDLTDYRPVSDVEINNAAIFIPEEDYLQINFDRTGGYIYGSPEIPLTNLQLSLDFSNAVQFSPVIIYHESSTIPTFDGLDTPNNIKIVGAYVTSELNRIVIIHEGNENITLGFVNDGGGTAIQDGVEVVGTITIPTPTTADLSGFTYRIAGVQFTSGTLTAIPITGTPTEFPRTDYFVGKFNPLFPSGGLGVVEYIAGTESENEIILPVIPPNAVLLGSVVRNVNGTNVINPEDPALSDFVSKSATGNQTIQSDLSIAPQSGTLPNYTTFGTNGGLQRSRPSTAGIFTTLQGIGGYSKLLTITIDPATQVNYYSVIEFHGISQNFEKGFLWVNFQVDGSGDIISNQLKCFGEFDITKYTLIKTSATTYTLFVAHDEVNSFYKFRPKADFGSNFRFEYHNLEAKVDPLPLGTKYFFDKYIENGVQELPDGLVYGGVVTWSGVGYEYNVTEAGVRRNGFIYVIPETTPLTRIVLATPDGTNPRIDTIFAFVDIDEEGVVTRGFDKITGTPAVDPVKPQVEDINDIELTFVSVIAGSTEPPVENTLWIYRENLDLVGTYLGTGSASFASTTFPDVGLLSIETFSVQNNSTVRMNFGSNINISIFDTVSLRLLLKTVLSNSHELSIRFRDDALNPVGLIANLPITKNQTGSYQNVAVPILTFNVGTTPVRYIDFVFRRFGGPSSYSGFLIDQWKLDGGIPVTPTITQHNGLLGKQGGNALLDEFYHLIKDHYDAIVNGDNPSALNPFITEDALDLVLANLLLSLNEVPDGGTTGQALVKQSDVDGDYIWATIAAGGGTVQSVTGDGVDNTDPDNPVLTFPTPADIGAVDSVTGDDVDNTDPINPVISTSPVASTGSVIQFDRFRTYNSKASPNTNTILTISDTAARGFVQVLFHQAASFTINDLYIEEDENSANYDPARVAIIYIEWFSATYRRYIITYDKP